MITVLMGAPGAGKTTWVKANASDEVILSSEAVRVYREDLDVGAFMNSLRLKGAKAVKEGKSVIIDATNTITAHRMYWMKISKVYGVNNRLIAFQTSLDNLLLAQRNRQYPAPDNIVRDHYRRFQREIQRVKLEGWQDLQIIKRGGSQ